MIRGKCLGHYLYELSKKYIVYLLTLIFIAISAGLLNIFVSYQIKQILDSIISNPNNLLPLVLFVLYKFMFHGVYFIERVFAIKYMPRFLSNVATDLYSMVTSHSLYWFESYMSGEISSKIMDFQDAITTTINLFFRLITSTSIILISIIFLVNVYYISAIVIIIFMLIYIPLLLFLLRKQLLLQIKTSNSRQKVFGIICDAISNIFLIKTLGTVSSYSKSKFFPSIKIWSDNEKNHRIFNTFYVDLFDTLTTSFMVGIQIWLITHLYKDHIITAGEFAFIVIVTLSVHRELDSLLENIIFFIIPKYAVMKSSYNFINSGENVKEGNIDLIISKGEILYDNVSFGYNENNLVLENFTLKINAGEKIGIVGFSGAGKTTLIKCLLKYFNISKGNILIDNYNIDHITTSSLRKNIAIIPQDITLLHSSIIDNLRVVKNDASLKEIKQACIIAEIHFDILKMSQGYETIVGERGIKLSGGQKQRIAIARAILKNAPILILDEATSSLDTITEQLIQKSIYNVIDYKNVTTIVISHRLSTLVDMDRIIVIDNKMVVESGTHEELLLANGKYNALWKKQYYGFLPTD